MNRDACYLLRLFLAACLLSLLLSPPRAGREQAARGTASVNGTRLAYEMQGEGRTVVLIHGGLVDSRMWDDQFKGLARRHRVIRYDLRGFGKSDFPTGPYSHVEDLHALLKFLKVERASLVGLSLGGMIATDFALEHRKIERLSEIHARTLIAVGDRDAANILAIADLLAAKIKGARKVTIKNVSHHLNMEKPREFNKVVMDFLAR